MTYYTILLKKGKNIIIYQYSINIFYLLQAQISLLKIRMSIYDNILYILN
jgi:hypothetical protein